MGSMLLFKYDQHNYTIKMQFSNGLLYIERERDMQILVQNKLYVIFGIFFKKMSISIMKLTPKVKILMCIYIYIYNKINKKKKKLKCIKKCRFLLLLLLRDDFFFFFLLCI